MAHMTHARHRRNVRIAAYRRRAGGRLRIAVALGMVTLLAGCAAAGNDSEREWQRAECNRVIDSDARERCIKRVEADYGSRKGDETPAKKR